MGTTVVSQNPAPLVNSGVGPVLVVNEDLTNVLSLGWSSAITLGGPAVFTVPPLGSLEIDVEADQLWAYSTANIVVQTIPGASSWTPSPAQVAAQINALGLAKDTSVQATTSAVGVVNGTLGTPAQDGTVSGVTAAVNAPSYGPPTHADVVTTGPAAITGGKKLSDVNTTLGTPSQDSTVSGLATLIPNNISVTGVPLLTGSLLVKNQSAVSQSPGTSGSSNTFSISQIGYEIILTIFAASNASSFFNLQLQWFDSVSGLQTAQEDYWFIPGTGSGSPHVVIGRGPTKGDQLVIVSSVPSTSSVAVTHSYVVLQNSRPYDSDRYRTLNMASFSTAGLTATAADPSTNTVASTNTSVGAGATLTRTLPFFHGLAKLVMSTNSGNTDGDLQINQYANWSQSGPSQLPNLAVYHGKTDSNGLLYQEITLPKGQCQAVITNNNAASKVFGLSIIAEELPTM